MILLYHTCYVLRNENVICESVVMFEEMWKNDFKAEFENNHSNDDADVGFYIDMPYKIYDSRKQYRCANDGIVDGFYATGNKSV